MVDHETRGIIPPAEPVQDARLARFNPYQPADHQDRPPVVAFDPYFTSSSSGNRDFDELMWECAA